jgi:hypothetical protein
VNTATTTRRRTALVATIGALTVLAGVAPAAASKPAGMPQAEYRALMLRSEALDQKYKLDTQRAVPAGMSAAAYRALMLRSGALNRIYGIGEGTAVAPASQPTSSTHGFAWDAFGIGALAMLGLVVLASGLLAASRSVHRVPRTRTTS